MFDKNARKTENRQQLRKATSLSDEIIEGWYTMLLRNPHKDHILEKYEWRGNKAPVDQDVSDASDSTPSSSPRQYSSNRGRGTGR